MKYIISILALTFFAISIKGQESYLNNADYFEKTYLNTDRSIYVTGETVWFSIFCTESNFNIPSEISSVASVELLNKNNFLIEKQKIKLENGTGSGNFTISDNLVSDYYKIRAYTKWSGNYNEYSRKNILIINPHEEIFIQKKEIITDVNFYPEGGSLLQRVENKILIKISSNLKTTELKGEILSDGKIISSLTFNNNLALTSLLLESGSKYNLKIYLNDSTSQLFDFPDNSINGTNISIKEINEQSTLFTLISNSLNQEKNNYTLKIVKNSAEYYKVNLSDILSGQQFEIKNSNFPFGISCLILMNQKNEIVSTRPYYKNYEIFSINTELKNTIFKPKEKIAINLHAFYKKLPITTNLSVKVLKNYELNEIHSGDLDCETEIFTYQSDLLHSLDKNTRIPLHYLVLQYIDHMYSFKKNIEKNIPEYKGIIISGKIIEKATGKPAENQLIFFSFIDKNAMINSCITDSYGKFNFTLNNGNSHEIVISCQDFENDYTIVLDDQFSDNFKENNKSLLISEKDIPLLENFIQTNAINNAFNISLQNATETKTINEDEFYGNPDQVLILSEYIKLPILEEFLLELVKRAIINTKNGKKVILISDKETNKIIGDNPLYLVDGIPIFDAEQILKIDPTKIKIIKTLGAKYYLGDNVFDGILDIETIDGDFSILPKQKNSIRKTVINYAKASSFINNPEIKNDSISNLPNYRNTIYWNPKLTTDNKGFASFSFISPDEEGIYDIVIFGISTSGKLGYYKHTFEVRKPD